VKKPVSLATESTRRQALRLAARALSVAELVLRAQQEMEPERRPPAVERARLRVLAGRVA
jgi:hypothetical protein